MDTYWFDYYNNLCGTSTFLLSHSKLNSFFGDFENRVVILTNVTRIFLSVYDQL